jgi:hypothetical protein
LRLTGNAYMRAEAEEARFPAKTTDLPGTGSWDAQGRLER